MKHLFTRCFIWILVLIVATSGCASLQNLKLNSKPVKIEELRKLRKVNIKKTAIAPQDVNIKIARYKKYLNYGPPFSKEFWKVHDELLEIYNGLKDSNSGYKIVIPANSQIKLKFRSFCLAHNKAGPSNGENFKWATKTPSIPYYEELFTYWDTHPEIYAGDIQTLIWNLGSGTYFENYPPTLQRILLEIDPEAQKKLPSKIKSQLFNIAKDLILDSVPLARDARNVYYDIKGQFYNYQHTANRILELKSRLPFIQDTGPTQIPGTPLYSDITNTGFSEVNSTFYNPSNNDVTIDTRKLHLEPQRDDVQPLGVFHRNDNRNSNPDLVNQLEKLLFEDLLRVGIGFTPVLNDIADLFETVTGKDFINGRALSFNERLLSAVGLLVSSGQNLRWANRAASAPGKYLDEFENGFNSISPKNIKSIDQSSIQNTLNAGEETLENINKSPTLRNIKNNPDFKSTDFYARPNGDIIPATGYRYIPSEAPYIDSLKSNGRIPANPDGTYITFNNFSDMQTAKSNLQIPHDVRYKVEFDTMQIEKDLRIPKGRFGESDYLEPITNAYPEHGAGGSTQAITELPISSRRITDLQTGEVLYEKN